MIFIIGETKVEEIVSLGKFGGFWLTRETLSSRRRIRRGADDRGNSAASGGSKHGRGKGRNKEESVSEGGTTNEMKEVMSM